MNVAGAYWKGQEGNPQLPAHLRSPAFFSRRKSWTRICHRIEEAKRRDHTAGSATELDLFSIQEESRPRPHFSGTPRGGAPGSQYHRKPWLRDELQKTALRSCPTRRTSCVLDLWKNQRPYRLFTRTSMFRSQWKSKKSPTTSSSPMNCPGHIFDLQVEAAPATATCPSASPSSAPSIVTNAAGRAPRPCFASAASHQDDGAHLLHAPSQIRKRSRGPASTSAFAVMKNFGLRPKFRNSSFPDLGSRPASGKLRPGKPRKDWHRATGPPLRPTPWKRMKHSRTKRWQAKAGVLRPEKSTLKLIDGHRPFLGRLTTPCSSIFNLPARFPACSTSAKTAQSNQPLMVHRARCLAPSSASFFGIFDRAPYAGGLSRLWLAPRAAGSLPGQRKKVADLRQATSPETLKRHNLRVPPRRPQRKAAPQKYPRRAASQKNFPTCSWSAPRRPQASLSPSRHSQQRPTLGPKAPTPKSARVASGKKSILSQFHELELIANLDSSVPVRTSQIILNEKRLRFLRACVSWPDGDAHLAESRAKVTALRPLWVRDSRFPHARLHIILEQQVSLASAKSGPSTV